MNYKFGDIVESKSYHITGGGPVGEVIIGLGTIAKVIKQDGKMLMMETKNGTEICDLVDNWIPKIGRT
jgi:hypothetical protein